MAHRWAAEVFCSWPQSILFSICTMSCLLIWFESLQKVAVNGELTVFLGGGGRSPVFGPKKRLNFGEDFFFWRSPDFDKKTPQSNSRVMKIWVSQFYYAAKAAKT